MRTMRFGASAFSRNFNAQQTERQIIWRSEPVIGCQYCTRLSWAYALVRRLLEYANFLERAASSYG